MLRKSFRLIICPAIEILRKSLNPVGLLTQIVAGYSVGHANQ